MFLTYPLGSLPTIGKGRKFRRKGCEQALCAARTLFFGKIPLARFGGGEVVRGSSFVQSPTWRVARISPTIWYSGWKEAQVTMMKNSTPVRPNNPARLHLMTTPAIA
jgi:hypothetical protein